jgi:hypothetical protein
MTTTENNYDNVPIKISFALYINGIYVPAAGANITVTQEEIISDFSLVPLPEIMLLGRYDRLHFAFFIKDPVVREYVLFTEGEIIGFSIQHVSTSSFVVLRGRSFKNVLDIPMSSIVGSPETLSSSLDPTTLQTTAPASMILLSGFSGITIGKDSPMYKQISSPFDYVRSAEALLLDTSGIKASSKEEASSNADIIKKFRGSYFLRFTSRYIRSKNITKKIIPDLALCAELDRESVKALYSGNQAQPQQTEQEANPQATQQTGTVSYLTAEQQSAEVISQPLETQYESFYQKYVQAVQTSNAISNILGQAAQGSVIGIVNKLVSMFDVISTPITLPPLVRLYAARTNVTDSFKDPGKLRYDMGGNIYIGNVLYRTNNLFTVIPKSNYITSDVISVKAINYDYISKITRLYTYFSLPNNPNTNSMLSLTAAYPKILNNLLLDHPNMPAGNLDLSILISREEAFRGPRSTIIQPHQMHMMAVQTADNDKNEEIKSLGNEYLAKPLPEGNNIGRLTLLERYSWYMYEYMTSTECNATIEMPFNPYIIIGYPLLFVDKKTLFSFVGIPIQISFSLTANSATTSIQLQNVIEIKEYITKINKATEEHEDFRVPAPYYVPKVDWLTQTYYGGEVYFGEIFYRTYRPGNIIKVEDVFYIKDYGEISFEIDPNTQKTKLSSILYKKISRSQEAQKIADNIAGNNQEKNTEVGSQSEAAKQNVNTQPGGAMSGVNAQPVAQKETEQQEEYMENNIEIDIRHDAPGFGSFIEYLATVYRPGITIEEYKTAHIDCGYLANGEKIVDGDKLMYIFDMPYLPPDKEDVNDSNEGLCYSDIRKLLTSYTQKVLSRTPEPYLGDRKEGIL